MIFLTWIGHECVEFLPKYFSKFVVWFGFGTLGDGVLCAIVDTATRHTSGDFYKLPNYYENAEGSPIAGYIVVICIYLFFLVLNLLIFYNYVVFMHLNGRMQDIYIRLLGDPKIFFCPDDNELSLRHLLWCYYSAIVNSQRIVVNKMFIENDLGEAKGLTTMQTSTYETNVTLTIMRTFIRDEKGCIKELTEPEISYLNVKEYLPLTNMLAKVPTYKSAEFYGKVGGIATKNLGLQNIENANPYRQKILENEQSQMQTKYGSKNAWFKPKRRNSGVVRVKSGVPASKKNRDSVVSRKSSKDKYSRRSSLKSKQSLRSSLSKKKKPSNLGRKMTYMRRDSAKQGGLSRVKTTFNGSIKKAPGSPTQSQSKFKPKYL